MFEPGIPRALRRTSVVMLAALFVLAAAACGSAKDASTSTATGSTASGSAASGSGATGAQEAYRACLQEHGVANGGGFGGRGNRASGAGGGGQVAPAPNASGATGFSGPKADGTPRTTIDQATLDAAQTACASLRPAPGSGASGGFGGFGGSGANGAGAQQFSAYLSCLSDNGVVTPTGGPGGSGTPGGSGVTGTPGFRGLGSIDRNSPAFTAANDKCKVLLPDGVDPFAGGGARGGPPGAAPTTTAAN